MKLVLHIGTEKTGTTSFQEFCHHSRRALLQRGVLYPEELGGINHRLVPVYTMTPETADEYAKGLGAADAKSLAALREKTRDRLTRQVERAREQGAHVCILSSEHLHSRLYGADQIAVVRELVTPLFEEIEVLVHLRPQVEVAVSLASTQARTGGAVRRSFFDKVTPCRLYYNYDSLVRLWEDVFGAERVVCIPFRRQPDIRSVLFGRLGVPLDDLPVPPRINEALDVRTMAMVNALADSGRPERIDFRVLDRLPVTEKLRIDLITAQGIQARFVPGNQALVARRPELAAGALQPDWARYSNTGNLEILDQRSVFGPAFAALLAEYNAALAKSDGAAQVRSSNVSSPS